MKKVAIVFYSETGNTKAMAEAVLEGANQAGADARMMFAEVFTSVLFDAYDAVAFGCPSMGVEELEEEVFEPMFSSLEDKLKNKRVALFGSYGWGDGEWMQAWKDRTLALGATLIVDPVIANEDPDAEAIEACKTLGSALAK